MIFKSGVKMEGIRQVCFEGMCRCDELVGRIRVTSVCDDAPGRKANSFHKRGLAFDVNEVWWSDAIREEMAVHFRNALGPDWQVIVKHAEGIPHHIHCEYDKKEEK